MSLSITRTELTAEDLRRAARTSKSVSQARRCLAIASVLEGRRRGDAAEAAGMQRQTLRDWVHRRGRDRADIRSRCAFPPRSPRAAGRDGPGRSPPRDDVDGEIGEEVFGVAIAGSRPKGFRGPFGGGLVSRRDGAEFEPREPLHGRHMRNLRPPPLGAGADDPDLQWFAHGLLPLVSIENGERGSAGVSGRCGSGDETVELERVVARRVRIAEKRGARPWATGLAVGGLYSVRLQNPGSGHEETLAGYPEPDVRLSATSCRSESRARPQEPVVRSFRRHGGWMALGGASTHGLERKTPKRTEPGRAVARLGRAP